MENGIQLEDPLGEDSVRFQPKRRSTLWSGLSLLAMSLFALSNIVLGQVSVFFECAVTTHRLRRW